MEIDIGESGMKYPDFEYAHYHRDGLQVVHPANWYSWNRILEMTEEMVDEGRIKNLWIGEDTIQYEAV